MTTRPRMVRRTSFGSSFPGTAHRGPSKCWPYRRPEYLFQAASTPFVIILDDDAYFMSAHTAQQTLDDFTSPSIAAIAIPFIENGTLMQGDMSGRSIELTRSFIGAAHGLRRDAVLDCGGLRESYKFYCEESDIAIRLLAAGMVVRHGTSDPVVHCPMLTASPAKASIEVAQRTSLQVVPHARIAPRTSRRRSSGPSFDSVRAIWRPEGINSIGFRLLEGCPQIKVRTKRRGLPDLFLVETAAKIPRLTLGAIDHMLVIRRGRQGQESS